MPKDAGANCPGAQCTDRAQATGVLDRYMQEEKDYRHGRCDGFGHVNDYSIEPELW